MSQVLMQKDKAFCEIVAKDRRDPLDNKFEALSKQDEWPKQWDKDVLYYDVITGTKDIKKAIWQRQAVNLMMTMWDIEIDMDLHPLTDEMKEAGIAADIRIYFKSSLQESYFKDRPATLAFAYYPGQGDISGIMVFNDDYYWNLTGEEVDAWKADPIHYTEGDGKKLKGYNFISVGGHEFGHVLGLTHSTRGLGLDLMDPYYNPDNFLPSMYDILRVLVKYPREQYRRWGSLGMLRKWMRIRILRYKLAI